MIKKKVCVDINSIVPLYAFGYLSGIGRTTLELLEAMAEIKDELPFDLILYTQNLRGVKGRNFGLPFLCSHVYLRNKARFNWFVGDLRLRELLTGYDLMHFPGNFGYTSRPQKTVITMHDAMFFSYPEDFLGHDFARRNYPGLALSCAGIATCSQSSKRDIVEYIGVPEEKITVIPWGVSPKNFYPEANSEIVSQTLSRHGIARPYFMMASCDLGRKNTELLMRNFRRYVKQGGGYDLALVWSRCPDRIKEEYREEIDKKRIHLLGGLSDADLRTIYSAAEASFFPSRYEGFGLPILESLACGTPVVTCRNSSLEEVGGDVALYVSADSETEMADMMTRFEQGNIDKPALRRQALLHASRFTWEKAAHEYARFYQQFL